MNPAIFVGLAITGLLAIMIFLGASERSSRNIELAQEKQQLEKQQFDRDFANFLEVGQVEKPELKELEAQKQKIAELEEKKRIADLEEEKRRAEMQKTLENLAEG
jgi:hypothetical protein